MVSSFAGRPSEADPTVWAVSVGDLLSGEDSHVVVRFGLPRWDLDDEVALRARLVWMDCGTERATDWHDVRFTYADTATCEAEQPAPEAALVIGQHLADRANREAIRLSKQGDIAGASARLRATSGYVARFARSAPMLVPDAPRSRRERAADPRARIDAGTVQGDVCARPAPLQRQARPARHAANYASGRAAQQATGSMTPGR